MHKSQTDLANLELKIHLMVEALANKNANQNYLFECLYHDVPLSLESSNKSFINYLKEYLPLFWQTKSDRQIKVICFHTEHSEFENYCPYEVEEYKGFVVQRDFIAKEIFGVFYILFNQNLTKFRDGFHNSMRWLLFDRFIDYQKICLHSSVVIDQNFAYVFLGHSGAGKSTTTQLSLPRLHLGDDMNIVSYDDVTQKYHAQAALLGQAFDTSSVNGLTYYIRGFYWLNQSEKHELIKYSKVEALSKLLQSIPSVKTNSEKAKKLFNICHGIISHYPIYQLNFRQDGDFWEKIYEQNI